MYIMKIVSRDFLKENIIHIKDIYYFRANFKKIIYTRLHNLRFFGAPKSLQMVTAAMKLKDAYSLEEK